MHQIYINYNIYTMVSIFLWFGLAKFQNVWHLPVMAGDSPLKVLLPPRAVAKWSGRTCPMFAFLKKVGAYLFTDFWQFVSLQPDFISKTVKPKDAHFNSLI